MNTLRYIALAGNVVFFLWILRNGIGERFHGTGPQVVSYFALMILLVVNAWFLYRDNRL